MADNSKGTIKDYVDNDMLPALSEHVPDWIDLAAVDVQTEITIPVEMILSGLECAASVNSTSVFERQLAGVGVQATIFNICKRAIEAQDKQKEKNND